jgi:ABC-type amino acid transport substrate-binding protein
VSLAFQGMVGTGRFNTRKCQPCPRTPVSYVPGLYMQQKLNPGLCSVHPDKPFQYGEKAWLLPRGDVTFQQYVDQWLHLARATGEYQAISDKWLK